LTAVPEEPPRPLLTPGRVRALLDRHGLRPSKALGQHYLADPNTARKVARLGGAGPTETVLEVGPGLGSLTLALRQAGARVVAVEADPRLLPALAEVLGDDPGVRVEVADALRVDLAALAPEATRLVANLPYNIAATLVLKVLAEAPAIARLVVMVQREVGERLAAVPSEPAFGAVSLKVAYRATVKVVRRVGPSVFWPEPAVESVVLRLDRRPPPVTVPAPVLFGLIEEGFRQRRKTMASALVRMGRPREDARAALRLAGLDDRVRAEALGLEEFARLADALDA
jgi:16S rRNA (adenine1518-N6/adenine1519-N6)-dimethyltransferase